MQSGLSTYKTVPSTQHNPTQQSDIAATNAIIGSLAIALPVVVLCAIAGYRKHQSMLMQRRVQRLNRIWQLDSSKKLS